MLEFTASAAGVGDGLTLPSPRYRGHGRRVPDLLHLRWGTWPPPPSKSARLEGTAQYKLRTYTGPSLLVIDEVGQLLLDQPSGSSRASAATNEKRLDDLDLQLRLRRLRQVLADPVVPSAISTACKNVR